MRFGSADYRAMTGVMRASMVRTVGLDLTACLRAVSAPTLLLWGEKDAETPIADGRKMERLIRGSRLIVVAGAGHFSYLDSPTFVNAVVSAFLHGTREGATRMTGLAALPSGPGRRSTALALTLARLIYLLHMLQTRGIRYSAVHPLGRYSTSTGWRPIPLLDLLGLVRGRRTVPAP